MSAALANRLNSFWKLALGAGAVGGIIQSAIYDVDVGHRVVMFDRFNGVLDKTTSEGTHFLIPWVQTPHLYDVRIMPRTIETQTGTKDLQTVKITLRVLVKPNIENLPKLHKELGPKYGEQVLPSICNEVLKGVVAEYNAEQLLIQRDTVKSNIGHALRRRAQEFDLTVDDVAITHLTFGTEFSKAIEAKQVASQEAERAKFVVERTEFEKQATVIKADGEAESAQILSQSFAESGKGLIEIRRIEAAKEIAETLARARNVTYLPSGQGVLMNLGAGR